MTSLYRRLLAWLLASLGVLWLAVGCSVYVTVRRSLEGRFDSELRAMASEVRHLFSASGHLPAAKTSGLWFDFFQKDGGVYFEVWDEFLLFSDKSPSLGQAGLPLPDAFGESPQVWNFTLATGEKVRGVAQQFVLAPPRPPGLAEAGGGGGHRINVVAARNRDDLDQGLARLLAATVLVGVLIVPLSFLIVWVAVARGLHPLRSFAERAASFGFESLGERFPTTGVPGELLPITHRLNELMDRLEAGVERERRLNADLAHELRTPVAELKTMAEVALAWPDQISAENYREVLGAAKEMQSIIESMLLLARWERDPVRPALEEVQVAELVKRCWQPHAGTAESKRLQLRIAIEPGTCLKTSPELFQIILANLMANAVSYSPDGAAVSIESSSPQGRFRLSVSNPADHLEREDLPRLFERFWRRDAARSGAGHAGLGLALAKTCADLLGLELSTELTESPRTIIFRLATHPRSAA